MIVKLTQFNYDDLNNNIRKLNFQLNINWIWEYSFVRFLASRSLLMKYLKLIEYLCYNLLWKGIVYKIFSHKIGNLICFFYVI